MGDRTNVTMTIYACPPEKAAAVLGIIDEYGLGTDWGWSSSREEVHTELALGSSYVANEVSCGFVGEAGSALIDLGEVAFEVTEDGYGDWLGETWQHIPDLGDFRQECDNNQQAVWNATEILAAFHGGYFTNEATTNDFLGNTFAEKIEELALAAEDVRLPRVEVEA